MISCNEYNGHTICISVHCLSEKEYLYEIEKQVGKQINCIVTGIILCLSCNVKTAETKLVSVIVCYRFIPFALHQSYTRRLYTSQTNLHTFIVHAKQMLWLLEEYQTFWHLCPNNLFTETCDKIMFLINFY